MSHEEFGSLARTPRAHRRYLIRAATNLPIIQLPDADFMAEAIDHRCANCGRSVRFLLTDTDLQLIGPSGKFMGSVEFSAKENHGARQRPLSTDPGFEITLDGQ